MKCRKYLLALLAPAFLLSSNAQESVNLGKFTGNFQLDGQYYMKDSKIGAEDVKEKILSNGFFNLNYVNGNIYAGIRYENYENPILGTDSRYKGSGIANRYIRYNNGFIDATAGNFYEQFGSGMILRSYEEKQLGIDNSIDGVKVKLYPTEGVELTALIGKERAFWSVGESIVRGADANFDINALCPSIMGNSVRLSLGASVVSKYQEDKDPTLKLPENVAAGAFRFNLAGEKFSLGSEFAYKINDPSATNNKTYNDGTGFMLQGAYFDDGIGVSLNFHRIDNMDFRADRNARGNYLNLNYIPPISKQHSYSLTSMYPYSTQLNGEVGMSAELNYTFSKESFLGGKDPWSFTLNYSRAQAIDTTNNNDRTYDSPFFTFGKRTYFQDVNLYASKKISKNVKANFALVYELYDRDLLEKEGEPHFGKVQAITAVADFTFKLNAKNAIRAELQHQWYSQDSSFYDKSYNNGNWVAGLVEYTVAPKWYFTIMDEYNYGNEFSDKQLHYLTLSTAYVHEGTRVQIGYGRQRAGILCVGGVCRQVPSANGFNLSVSSSF
jgi:hypothetical protein